MGEYMQTQFQYIIEQAKKYSQIAEHPALLFKTINEIPQNIVGDIYKEYNDPDSNFQPVNLLRAEIARQLMNSVEINEDLVEEIKEKIRNKELTYFKHLPKNFLDKLEAYPIGKRDMFANWKPWRVFHTFFYRGKEKETVLNYLKQIANDLLVQLDLKDYTSHEVDFQGATNFGSDECWIVLYPVTKGSHTESFQFFIKLSAEPKAGMKSGHSIRNKSEKLEMVDSYDKVLAYLKELKPEIVKLNIESRNYFKFSPGPQASEWGRFYSDGIAAISFSDLKLGDLNNFNSREEINEAIGKDSNSQSNKTWSLWLFKNANIGDVVFATKGVNTCIGIGIIEDNYYFDSADKSYKSYPHRRKVNWITKKEYQLTENSLKTKINLFRTDAFSPSKEWKFILNEYARMFPDLVTVFEKYNLKYNNETGSTPTYTEKIEVTPKNPPQDSGFLMDTLIEDSHLKLTHFSHRKLTHLNY